MGLKKRHIIRMLFKSRKGLGQSKKYNKKAKEFWKVKEQKMIDEITKYMTGPEEKLLKLSRNYAKKIGFNELICNKEDVESFKRILKHFGEEIIVPDFVRYATRTGFLTVVIAPAIAAADGLDDVDEKSLSNWLYGIGICLPVSADVCDSVLDEEVLRHPLIPYGTWITCHKLGAAIIFYIGLENVEKIKAGDGKIKKRILKRLKEGLANVSEKQMADYKAQTEPYTSLNLIEKIYEGKICEIEATVFGTIPSKKLDIIKIFEEGARFFAGELQIADDIEDLLGDDNLGKEPSIPNPSFFLTYCIDLWNKGESDIKKVMEDAMKRTLERGKKYHEKVEEALEKLPKDFPTRPFFEITLWYYNKVLKNKVKQFLKGNTFSEIEPKLLKILKSR